MLQYSDLNNDEKRRVREILGVDRVGTYHLEDNGYMLMDINDLFEYIFLCDINKLKDALSLINRIKETVIKESDINKTIQEVLIDNRDNVNKISSRVYLYKDNNY